MRSRSMEAGSEEVCIDDEIPFEIPENWTWCRLNELCKKIGAGSTPTGGKAVYVSDGVKFIRSQNVYNDGLRLNDIAYITEETNSKKSGSVVKAKDILLNITGGSIGRCAIVPDNFDIANVNQHVMIIRLINPAMRQWIHAILISEYIQNLIMDVQVGVSREGLSATKLMNFLIPLPPISEQERILKFYAKVSAQLISLQSSHYEKLDGIERCIDDEIPFEIPDSWEWVRMGSLFTVNPRNAVPDDTTVGFMSMPLLQDGFNNSHTFEEKPWKDVKSGFTHFADNDVVVAKITPCFQNRKSAVIRNLPNGYGAGIRKFISFVALRPSLETPT